MERKIIKTADGSHTIRIDEWNEQYHSVHGAIAESIHVFIKHGLQFLERESISILEMGFGTGLNALLTFVEAEKSALQINYTAIEAYPVKEEEWSHLNYADTLGEVNLDKIYQNMHKTPWGEWVTISDFFRLLKLEQKIEAFEASREFQLVYFDAFGYRVQPELWSETVFLKMFEALEPGGVLVTYAAKGIVRRTMEKVGFRVERLPGPPGKREMLRAIK